MTSLTDDVTSWHHTHMFVQVLDLLARARISVQENHFRVSILLQFLHQNVDGDVLGRHVSFLHERPNGAPLALRLLSLENLCADFVAHGNVSEARVGAG